MKKFISVFMSAIMVVVVSLGTFSVLGVKTAWAETNKERKSISENLTNDLLNGRYKDVVEKYKYTTEAKKEITENVLRMVMEQKKSQTGEFKKIIDSSEQQVNNLKIVAVNILNENSENTFVVTFNEKDEIQGLDFTRAKALDDPNFYGQNVVFGGDKFKLNGTLNLPKQTTDTLVIVVHGAGPSDRNLTEGPNKAYLDIAKDLTSKGIATFRYDKRSYTYGDEVYQGDTTLWGETIEDALYAVKYFRNNGAFKHIYILGHSIGGYSIPMMDKMANDVKIDGYISLAGSIAVPFEDLMMQQYEYLASLNSNNAAKNEAMLKLVKEKVDKIKSLVPGVKYKKEMILNFPTDFWINLKNYKPIEDAKNITKPVFILNGDRDYQVTKEQFNIYKNELGTKANYTFKLYEGLNHLFFYGTEKSTPKEYSIKSHVDSRVTEDIANWVKKNNK